MRRLRPLAIAFIAASLAACSDQASDAFEDVDVTMQQSDGLLARTTSDWFASVVEGSGSTVTLDKDTVASLTVRVSAIQFLPTSQEANASDDGVWIDLELGSPVTLELLSLPTETESPLVIAAGSVPVGDYADVRLLTAGATIRFTGPVDLGVAFGFEAETDYTVSIPSNEQTGIKTDAAFTVEADAQGNENDVHLLFSPDDTFLNVSGTGTGEVILAPVIRERPDETL